MGRTVCTEPQCLYKGDLYLTFTLVNCITVTHRKPMNILHKLFVTARAILCTCTVLLELLFCIAFCDFVVLCGYFVVLCGYFVVLCGYFFITMGSAATSAYYCCVCCEEKWPSEMKCFVYVIMFTAYAFYLLYVVTVLYNGGSCFYFENIRHCK